MRQVIQSLKTGSIELADVPCPALQRGSLLIRSNTSLISAGTERMLLEFGKAGWLGKMRQQPDKVRQVLDKINTDGLLPTLHAVNSKLDEPLPLGYCNVGTVLAVGEGVEGYAVGDRVASNGRHAEVVAVPQHLCAKIPDSVDDEAAAFVVLASIGLQGVRLAEPTLGESFVVMGLGLIGQITVQILRAHGCRVLGIDFDANRLDLARRFGAETVDLSSGADPVAVAMEFSRGRGVDGVLITASTKSNDPIRQAPQMCRKRGRVVLVGVVGLDLARADFYEKEVSFRVSCSYGPGRYDESYEENGNDYPIGFVRWTEQRNFEAVLDLMADGRIDVQRLITHRYPIDRVGDAYLTIDGESGNSLGILLQFPQDESKSKQLLRRTVHIDQTNERGRDTGQSPGIAFVGAGAFARHTLMPTFRQVGARLAQVASRGGLTALLNGRKFKFATASSDIQSVFDNPEVDAVVIATRHDSHADLTCQALRSNKHVFVEKPLALNEEQLTDVVSAYETACRSNNRPVLFVGFNRRFAPQVKKIHSLLAPLKVPKAFVMTVNAGAIPADHWAQKQDSGGGRIIGEGCHFVDLLRYLSGHPIDSVRANMFGPQSRELVCDDKMTITLGFSDGSMGTIHYLANGNKSFPKERLEVFCDGRILQLDNFRRLRAYGFGRFRKMNLWSQDKGHLAEVKAFVDAVSGKAPDPIPLEELIEVTRVTMDAVRAAKTGETVLYNEGNQSLQSRRAAA
ncbi:bi-domain-containing oxidoreductase [Rosistilla oblonga]|uniref:bi-domain-containing oxidoreductase n=1 Tax=Rosistilla oblonga TaxID=2527990 RepID=UPI003A97A04D